MTDVNPGPEVDAELDRARRASEEDDAARTELEQSVADGNLTFAELLEQGAHGGGDHDAGRIKIHRALIAVDGIGPIRAAEILDGMGIDPHKRLSELNEAQRGQLAAAIQGMTA